MTQPPPNYPPPSYPPPPPGYPAPPGYQAPPGGYSVPPRAAYPPHFRPLPSAPGGAPLADFGQRLAAYLLDGLVIAAVTLIPIMGVVFGTIALVFATIPQTPDRQGQPPVAPFLLIMLGYLVGIFLITFLAQYFYTVTYQLRRGQTVGKRVMKIKIVNVADGSPMDLRAARKRYAATAVLGLLGPASYLDGLWQLWDQPYKQCLHDKYAQTVVVRVPA